ncbi:protein OXIDATIVE STRESS 3 LIKE 1 [Corylus avellana]|uniref:protein OXIDATIVE STRESS 3 LIKE 1 n=1 Tax=Corylus avellana TaxID=13451 RepID=UPI001E1EE19D|nr:protein OXIDATIVE STRESS 3 LIKE 1 [Corylus avellana]
MSIELDSKPAGLPGGGKSCAGVLVTKEVDGDDLNACSSSSSIGTNSDLGSDGEDFGENEAQSSYRGPLDMMEALEEVLPIRRGISNFYSGKSKSFTSLAEASSSSSIKDVGKPENAYTRKRRNLLAFNHVWDKSQNLKSHMGGIAKRPLSSSRSTLAFAVTMSSSDGISSSSEDSSSRSPPHLPPPHPRGRSARRNMSVWPSFSSADLQQCGTLATTGACTTYELLTEPGLPK